MQAAPWRPVLKGLSDCLSSGEEADVVSAGAMEEKRDEHGWDGSIHFFVRLCLFAPSFWRRIENAANAQLGLAAVIAAATKGGLNASNCNYPPCLS